MDGKGNDFTRPVLVIKVVNKNLVLVVPLSTSSPHRYGYVPFCFKNKKQSLCVLQLKVIDKRRLFRRMGKVHLGTLRKIKAMVRDFLSYNGDMQIKIKKLHPDAMTPSYAHAGDAGMDVHTVVDITLEPGVPVRIPTGLSIELPAGYVSLFWDKSGLSTKHGLKTLGGVIEHTYRGEYQVGMINLGTEPYTFSVGDKVAQLLIQPIVTAETVEVDELSETTRGIDAFGSTGK